MRPGLTVKVVLQDIKKLETEALIFGFYENARPLRDLAGQLDWLLCGSLSHLIINQKLCGAVGDVALVTSRGKVPASKLFMVGLGPRETASPVSLQAAARTAVTSLVQAGVKNAVMECFSAPGVPFDREIPALVTGISEAASGARIEIAILAPDAAAYEKISRLTGGHHSA